MKPNKLVRLNNAAWTVFRFMHGYKAVYPVWHQIYFLSLFINNDGDIFSLYNEEYQHD